MSNQAAMVEQSDERDALRERLAGMWAGVAGGWAQNADYADARGAQSAERMLELAQVGAGDRVLELACGPGGLGLAAAQRVEPGGEVVLTDVAAEMTAIAVISSATSVRTTSPPDPTRSAAARPRPPGPHASSSTRSPGRTSASSSIRCALCAPRASA